MGSDAKIKYKVDIAKSYLKHKFTNGEVKKGDEYIYIIYIF